MSESFRLFLHNQEQETEEGLNMRAEQLLEKIDFQLLRDIFSEERSKSGLDTEDTNLLAPPSGIMFEHASHPENPGVTGQYSMRLNKIILNLKNIWEWDSGETFENELFRALCHEETHAVSTKPHQFLNIISFLRFVVNKPIVQTGLEYRTFFHEQTFSMFNEGVTDTIAEEVYDEYMRRSGNRTLFAKPDGSSEYGRSYPSQQHILKAFILVLSRVVGIPEDIVWSGIKQSYFSNANLADNKLVKLYEEVLKVNVANIIRETGIYAYLSTTSQLDKIGPSNADTFSNDLTKSIETMSWSDALIKRAIDAFPKQK